MSQAEDGAGNEVSQDPFGLDLLKAGWVPPAIGRAADRTVSADSIVPMKFVVLRTDEDDEWTFKVAGCKLWLGRVSARHLRFATTGCVLSVRVGLLDPSDAWLLLTPAPCFRLLR